MAPFKIHSPETLRSCVVFASPHSGKEYPKSFLAKTMLDHLTIRSSEDAFVDELFDSAPKYGAPLISAVLPRAYIDLNRSHSDLDPAIIEGVQQNQHNPRVAVGLGVIPRVVANGHPIYTKKISRFEADKRIKKYWYPYHATLQNLLTESQKKFGQVILIDCHSMPHEAIKDINNTVKSNPVKSNPVKSNPDIVLGDRFGRSANGEIVDLIEAAFSQVGFTITRNSPFAGAYTSQEYGHPFQYRHVIQVEIDRSIYMNEERIVKNADFETVHRAIEMAIAAIVQINVAKHQLIAE
ncbi:MAG: N-formylglutamate amidohydrolase [Aestuariivita sp.]|nr:N-formylglutamate amidohydrolase [Aestuariivita sp.]